MYRFDPTEMNFKRRLLPLLATMALAPVGTAMADDDAAAASAAAPATEVASSSGATTTDQVTDSDVKGLETVTVYAEKRPQNLTDVPSAVTALTSADLENASVNTVQDVAAMVPNLVMSDQLRPGITTISMRGVTTVQGGQSPFTVIVDGVQQPGQEFLKQQLVDVQQIEVLRGPQGTLYGAGAIAGAVNIVTKKPADHFEGSVAIDAGEGHDQSQNITLSTPIVQDKAYFRVSAWNRDFDGLIDNKANSKNADFVDESSYQGQLLLTPTDRLTVDLRAHFTSGQNGALWLSIVPDEDFDNFSSKYDPDEDIAGIDSRVLKTYSAKVDYAFDDFTLSSITAYNHAYANTIADGDFTSTVSAVQSWLNASDSVSQELRIASTAQGPLQYVGGIYLQNYNVSDFTRYGSVLDDGSYDFVDGSATLNRYKSNSWAAYGQATYDLTDRLSGTVGGRYDHDSKTAHNIVDDSHDADTFSEFQPKLSLTYKIAPQVNTFVSYAKGFRTGGFNPAVLEVQGVDALRTYQNETSDNYELGFKSRFLHNRLQINGSVFHSDFDNQQIFFSEATTSGAYTVITNIPKTRINGVELETMAVLNGWLRLNAGAGYTHTSINGLDGGEYNGNRTPQVYGFTANVSPEADWALPNGMDLMARVDYQHRGKVYWDLANNLDTPAKDFINARMSLGFGQDQRWTVSLIGRNLTDERTAAAVGADSWGSSTSLRSANEPRQIAGELRVDF